MMKLLTVMIAIVATTLASQEAINPFESFYRGQASPIGWGSLEKTKKFQMAKLAEENLSIVFAGSKTDQCLQRSLCAMGAAGDSIAWPRHLPWKRPSSIS